MEKEVTWPQKLGQAELILRNYTECSKSVNHMLENQQRKD